MIDASGGLRSVGSALSGQLDTLAEDVLDVQHLHEDQRDRGEALEGSRA